MTSLCYVTFVTFDYLLVTSSFLLITPSYFYLFLGTSGYLFVPRFNMNSNEKKTIINHFWTKVKPKLKNYSRLFDLSMAAFDGT